eukprot:1122426-Prorocentrum_minimum.AAC.2
MSKPPPEHYFTRWTIWVAVAGVRVLGRPRAVAAGGHPPAGGPRQRGDAGGEGDAHGGGGDATSAGAEGRAVRRARRDAQEERRAGACCI